MNIIAILAAPAASTGSASPSLPAPFKRTAKHRVCWAGTDPEVGEFLLSEGERVAYRIERIDVLHRDSLSVSPRLRLSCWTCAAADVPEGAVTHPWSRTISLADQDPEAVRRHIRLANARARAAEVNRVLEIELGAQDPLAVRKLAGSIAPVVSAQWDDPADMNERSRKPWQVRGHRTRDGLRDMRDAGGVTEAQWAAAELFRADLEVTQGARPQPDEVRVDICTTRSYEPPDYLLKATGRVREAWQIAIGIIASSVVVAVVVGGQPLDGFAAEQGWDAARARDVLIGALDRLATLYATTDRERRQGGRPRIDAVHQTPDVMDEAPAPADPANASPEAPSRASRSRPPTDEPFTPWKPPVVTRAAVSSAVARLMALGQKGREGGDDDA